MSSENKGVPIWALLLIAVLIFLPVIQLAVQNYSKTLGIQWPGLDEDVEYPTEGDIPVNRKISFSTPDLYGGSAVSTGTLTIYTESGVLLESLDISSTKITTDPYKSGTKLYCRLLNTNAKKWWAITVPKMGAADVDSQTNNPVKLEFFAIGTYTTKATDQAGNQISDAGSYNHTLTGAQATFSVSFWVASDNTGIMDSLPKDPLNDVNWHCILYLKTFGANYEFIDVTGFDYSWSRGAANWYAVRLTDTDLTKWKIGQEYEYDGTCSFTHGADFTSYTGDAADLQYYLEFYSEAQYMMDHGNAGPDHYQAAELTVNAITD